MIYSDIEVEIRKKLISDSTLQSILGVTNEEIKGRIRVGHVSNIDNPEYPCITFKLSLASLEKNEFSVSGKFHINVWTRDSMEKAQLIYERIRQLINLTQVDKVAYQREGNYEELYEKDTRTFHISTWYVVQAINR